MNTQMDLFMDSEDPIITLNCLSLSFLFVHLLRSNGLRGSHSLPLRLEEVEALKELEERSVMEAKGLWQEHRNNKDRSLSETDRGRNWP